MAIWIGFVAGSALITGFLAFGARRLLNTRFSLFRTVLAASAGETVASPVLKGLMHGLNPDRPDHTAAIWFLVLGWACALLIAMIVLVVWEAFVPTGTIPSPFLWVRSLRARAERTRRYWQITWIFARAGLGPYLRGRTRPEGESRSRLAHSLAAALDRGGVTFVKLGQVLSTRRDVLPEEFVAELGRLRDRAAPVPWERIEQVLRDELGAPVEEVFAEFEREPLAAASVAQVHTARLRTGEEVVVKVQRPGVRTVVERDLDIVRRLARTLDARAGWGRSLGIVELAEGFANALREELDFRIETRNMAAVASAHRNSEGRVHIPRPHEDLCSTRVLVMERLQGVPLGQAAPAITRRGLDQAELARDLLDEMLRQIMLDGVFHADPHPGNLLLLDDGRLGMIDFGSVGRLDTGLRASLGRILLAVNRADPIALTDALLEVTARPDELDEQALERALGAFMARHLAAGQTPDAAMFTELFRVMTRFALAVPAEFAAVFRALGTLEGGLTELAPGFDMVGEARAFGGAHLGERLRPEALRDAAANELAAMLPTLRRIPRRLDRITSAIEGGRLTVNVRLFADERDRATVTGLLHQFLLTLLASTAGVMAVLLLGLKNGPAMTDSVGLYQFLGYGMLVVCSVLALRVLVGVFRPRARH
ncbi:ABC1 kinase family protein [Actinomadura harenae]|uniref:AarF/ABC1/UbiB kinase family protein n=1 Tax=Actinomadura harenae TaxID=2483351 RepID=A0A3M2MCH2_9ACTN|nr:AarF/UbiB family protein [Actinomadura harenae]RMI47424.1 AarF/ABC1/UbiB kinase family protein [Actinomadura harenae]